MDETTVAPPAYDENDIITQFLSGQVLRMGAKDHVCGGPGGVLKSWAVGREGPTRIVQAFQAAHLLSILQHSAANQFRVK